MKRHGTTYSWGVCKCRCAECRNAKRLAMERYRRSKGIPARTRQEHGTSAYRNQGCRCDVCREAQRVCMAGRRAAA